MKLRNVALASFLVLAVAGTAVAAKGPALSAGGKTFAGPGSMKLAAGRTVTIIDVPPAADICVTLVNTGKETIYLLMPPGLPTVVDVVAGDTLTYCTTATHVNLQCAGQKRGCSCSWRGDFR